MKVELNSTTNTSIQFRQGMVFSVESLQNPSNKWQSTFMSPRQYQPVLQFINFFLLFIDHHFKAAGPVEHKLRQYH